MCVVLVFLTAYIFAMRTDKQIYKILAANPGWFFELTQITDPGRCVFRSVELKDIALTADGVIEPDAAEQPVFIVEFQAQNDEFIYTRLVQEMVLLQRLQPERNVEGVILFLDLSLDPRTEPWCRVVRVFSVLEQLQQLQQHRPEHPLVAVFRPLVESSNENLAANAAECYNQIAFSDLDERLKAVLTEVFVNWLEQRFRDKGKQEIEEMLVGALPDLTETQSGKDLIQIGFKKGEETGEVRGEAKGKRESLLLFLEFRFKDVPEAVREAVSLIQSSEHLDALMRHALQVDSLDDFDLSTGAPEA